MARPGARASMARRAFAAGLLALLPLVPAGPSAAAQDDGPPAAIDYLAGGLVDYAASGVPDFSQCRAGWDRPGVQPGDPGQWTHAAPVALADALWWLDSRAEPSPKDPSTASDGHPLVTAYPAFGPRRDDHAVENLLPLVADLAGRANTDGRRRPDAVRGSRWEDVVEGATAYVTGRAGAHYRVEVATAPDGPWLASVAEGGGSAVLALGVWEQQGEAWARIGGHYAALAGTAPAGAQVALSDPLADQAAEGQAGRMVPPEPARHSCRNDPRAHDDAAVVSHDAYALFPPPGLPGGRQALAGYFRPETFGEGAAFAGLNPMGALAEHEGTWQRGILVMAVDAALAILPRTAPTDPAPPTATATATAAATATPTPEPTSPEPTSPPTATEEPVPATATATTRPQPTPTRRSGPSRVHLPFAGFGGLPWRPIVRP